MKKAYLAIDIGASSGRHIAGWKEAGEIKTREIYRFGNGVKQQDGHLLWDTDAILTHVKRGIAAAKAEFPGIVSLSIDTWGVDYVLLCGQRELLPCNSYRNTRTAQAVQAVHALIPFATLYARTGIQFQPFNTVYQLYADKLSGRLKDATDFLMLPEYLLWKLCGVKAKEFTNATTTGLVNAQSGAFDEEIVSALGLPPELFPKLAKPGTQLGEYNGIKCVLCATHDTASAVEGIPMEGNHPYISSGTWSLLGVKTAKPQTDAASRLANYSNEGGVGYNRYQKNIMGLWLVNRLREELCPAASFAEIAREAESSRFDGLVDTNAAAFLAPERMCAAFYGQLGKKPDCTADYFRCACRSLAVSYRVALAELEANTGQSYERLYIVGGGAKNGFLTRLTAEATGKNTIALPIEATALGNLKLQMEAEQ